MYGMEEVGEVKDEPVTSAPAQIIGIRIAETASD